MTLLKNTIMMIGIMNISAITINVGLWRLLLSFLTFLMAVKYTDYDICTFYCHGIKGGLEYVLELASSHDVLFINEHWLQQKDIHTICSITETNNLKLWTYLKSSVDQRHQLNGRPYKGLGFLCRRTSGRFFKVIEHESDRVLGIQIF